MIITIDGPAGTGKSSVAREVAKRLGYAFLDTGAMYRAIGLMALRRGCDLDNRIELELIVRHAAMAFDWSKSPPELVLNGEPVGQQIRSKEVSDAASKVAQIPGVRTHLVEQQRAIGAARPDLVTEGRDQGTVVFPQAPLKFWVTATVDERARRRVTEHRSRGEMVDGDEIRRQLIERDHRDATRAIGPMKKPDGAMEIETTGLSFEDVVKKIVSRVLVERGSK